MTEQEESGLSPPGTSGSISKATATHLKTGTSSLAYYLLTEHLGRQILSVLLCLQCKMQGFSFHPVLFVEEKNVCLIQSKLTVHQHALHFETLLLQVENSGSLWGMFGFQGRSFRQCHIAFSLSNNIQEQAAISCAFLKFLSLRVPAITMHYS